MGRAPDSPDDWRFDYRPGTIRFGRGATGALAAECTALDCDRALVVTGQTVGGSTAVMDPVRAGLGDALAGVFAETTPAKRLATAVRGVERYRRVDADCLVAVGGGSSLDMATVVRLLVADDRDSSAVADEFAARGTITVPDGPLPPLVVVPTTLAGADLSTGAGVTARPDEGLVDAPVDGGISHPSLAPAASVYDPALVETTPTDVLAASAMNGFDKGIEAFYAERATPITDATAAAGLARFQAGLDYVGDDRAEDAAIESLVTGVVLVQYGCHRPEGHLLSIIHAFGHALSRASALQQGVAHGVVAPHVLAYVFDAVDGRRDALADALGVGDAPDAASAVVDAVDDVRDALGLPSRLRDVDGPTSDELPAVADAVLADRFMANGPVGLSPTADEILAVLEAAW